MGTEDLHLPAAQPVLLVPVFGNDHHPDPAGLPAGSASLWTLVSAAMVATQTVCPREGARKCTGEDLC